MKIWNLILYRFKMAARTKELYVYIIGFPLIFMLIYGGFAYSAYSTPETIDLGYMNLDQGAILHVGGENFSIIGGIEFKDFLASLEYNATHTKMYNIIDFQDVDKMRQQLLTLRIDAAIVVPENFSENLMEFAKSIVYSQLLGSLMSGLRYAQEQGNSSLINQYISAIQELQNFAPKKYKLYIEIWGDPTYSKATTSYEYTWRHLIDYATGIIQKLSYILTSYIGEKYGLELNIENSKSEALSSINVEFKAVGAPGVAKESFAKLYYAVLVPGQIMQTIILGAVSAIYLIGYDIESGLLSRLKLTKLKSSEYIGSTLLAWGIVSIFQSGIMIAVASLLGYIKFNGILMNYILAIFILVLAGILSASISLIIVSFLKPNVAGTMSLITLLVISLFIAGYFPIPNPVIGDFLGRQITVLDLFPWRAGITGLKQTLMLADQTRPSDSFPDIALLTVWTLIYSILSIIAFNNRRLKARES